LVTFDEHRATIDSRMIFQVDEHRQFLLISNAYSALKEHRETSLRLKAK
jgi:hypothetical protein